MNGTNIVDITIYKDEHKNRQPPKKEIFADELGLAIQGLIQRLRNNDPVSCRGAPHKFSCRNTFI